jgi:WD40-like Beta Propeller Repeat
MRSRLLVYVAGVATLLLVFATPATSRRNATQRIVFESTRTGNSDIWISSVDGRVQRNLTKDSTVDDVSPALSPDGKQIAFARVNGDRSQLWVMNADGSAARPLGTGKGSETHPAWSPNSDQIAFVSLIGNRWDVFVADLDGTRRQLTSDAAAQIDVSWTPKADQIVFDRIEKGTSDLWEVPVQGGAQVPLTKTARVAELNPAVSPDGSSIAYDAASTRGTYDLYVLNLKTKAVTQVTHDVADDGDPAWSPDGTMLAYRHEAGPDYEIAKVDVTGHGKPTNVSHDPGGLDLSPSWQVSGAALAARLTLALHINAQWIFSCDAAWPGHTWNETLVGNANVNHICGDGGNDKLYGCGNIDYLSGGGGTDVLHGYGSPCVGGVDGGDWLKARDGVRDYVYGDGGYDHGLLDAVDYVNSLEAPEY